MKVTRTGHFNVESATLGIKNNMYLIIVKPIDSFSSVRD